METDLRFPIGRYERPALLSAADRGAVIEAIADTPRAFRAALSGLNDTQLDTPYRPGGWTVRQVAHHLPDSHLNAYIRLKLALTEDTPTIKPYDEGAWATLDDLRTTPVETSLALLDALHDRWVRLLRAMGPEEFGRELIHPESGKMNVDQLLALYAWHGRHHTAHITSLRSRNSW